MIVGVLAAACLNRTAGQSSRWMSDRRWAAELAPAALAPTPTAGGTIGRARVRVHADRGYQAQNPDHQAKIRLMVARASQLLEPTTGMGLELIEIRTWQRQGGGGDLTAAIEGLRAADPGDDVDLVIGMVDALSQVSQDQHQMGIAQLLGRHLVVRGLDDAGEVAVIEKQLRTLSAADRQALYSRRKRHKEQVVFLHELAHALGGLHVTGERNILNPSYDRRVADFGQTSAVLMRAVVRARLARGEGTARREWAEVLAFARKNASAGWDEDDRAHLIAELERRAEGAEEKAAAGDTLGDAVRASDRERFHEAERLRAAGRALDAWVALEPLLDFYPEEPAVHRLACRLTVDAGRDRAEIESRCARTALIAPADAEPHLRLAQAYLAASDNAQSLTSAHQAQMLLERAGPEKRNDALWGELAAHLQALGAVTWAEKAAAATGQAAHVAGWARLTRARYGLAPGGPVAPEREAEYVTGIRALLAAVYSGRLREADAQAAGLQRSFRGAAGIHAARCDLEIRRHRYPSARTQCRDALRRYADASWAQYLTGLLDKHDNRPATAAEHLERAIALDPEIEHAYKVAAETYEQLGRPADKQRIADAYRAKFGRELR